MQNLDDSWYESADRAALRDSKKRPADLRYAPGIYTNQETGEQIFCDVWTYAFLNTTPYNTFKELFNHVEFLFERDEDNGKSNEKNSRVSGGYSL